MTLRLPQIQRGGVQSLGRKDVNSSLRVARAQGQAAQDVASLLVTTKKIQIENEDQQRSLNTKKREEEFLRSTQGKEFFDAKELPEDLRKQFGTIQKYNRDTKKMETVEVDQIHRSDVFPELYKREMDAIVEEEAAGLSKVNKRRGQLWKRDKQSIVSGKYTDALVQNTQLQIKRAQNQRDENVKEAVKNGEYALAAEINKSISDPEVRNNNFDFIAETKEIDQIYGTINEADERFIMSKIDEINSDSYDGRLGDIGKKKYIASLETALVTARKKKNESIIDALAKDDYEGALQIARTISDDQMRLEKIESIQDAKEYGTYRNAVRENDEAAMRSSLKFLEQPYKDYKGQGGDLEEKEALAAANMLRTRVDQIDRERASKLAGDKSLATDKVTRTTEELFNGGELDAGAVELVRLTGEASDVNAKNMNNLAVASQMNPGIRQILMMDDKTRERAVIEFQNNPNAVPNFDMPNKLLANEMLANAVQKAIDAQNEDNYAWSMKFYGLETTPIDWSNPQNFAITLAARMEQNPQVESLSNREADLMSDAEAAQYSKEFLAKGPAEQMDLIAGASLALGDNITKLLNPMAKYLTPTTRAAANMTIEGKKDVALLMLEGQGYLEQETVTLPSWTIEGVPALVGQFNQAFAFFTPGTNADYMDAAKALYAYQVANTSNANNGVIDTSVLEKVATAITGEMVKAANKTVLPPVRGWTQDVFDNWVTNLSQDKFTLGKGTMAFATADDLSTAIENGRVQLFATERGKYILKDTRSGQFLESHKQGELFELTYDKNDVITRTKKQNLTAFSRRPKEKPATRAEFALDEKTEPVVTPPAYISRYKKAEVDAFEQTQIKGQKVTDLLDQGVAEDDPRFIKAQEAYNDAAMEQSRLTMKKEAAAREFLSSKGYTDQEIEEFVTGNNQVWDSLI